MRELRNELNKFNNEVGGSLSLNLLIVDDSEFDLESISFILKEIPNIEIYAYQSARKALNAISEYPKKYALVLTDFNMPELNGIELAKAIWKNNPKQLIAMFSGDKDPKSAIQCVGTPIVEFLSKGEETDSLIKKVNNLLQKYIQTQAVYNIKETLSENRNYIKTFGLIGESDQMLEVCRMIKKYSPSEASILIRGESGSGKELVARAIHKNSARREGPFVAININSFTETLIESELFGHEKGSFTGATSARKGAFEEANGGTLFIDEIGDLKPSLQVKLLRVLQEKQIQPIGSMKQIKINVRFVFATHVNLEENIKNNLFRLDLFHRISVLDLKIPSLKERKDDIYLLVNHFLLKFDSNKKILTSAIKFLEKYHWPGNVRELENLIQKLSIIVDGEEIGPEHLPSEMFSEIESSSEGNLSVTYKNYLSAIEHLEMKYLVFHLSKSRSIRDAALNRMEMPLQTLRDRMKYFNLEMYNKGEKNDETIQ